MCLLSYIYSGINVLTIFIADTPPPRLQGGSIPVEHHDELSQRPTCRHRVDNPGLPVENIGTPGFLWVGKVVLLCEQMYGVVWENNKSPDGSCPVYRSISKEVKVVRSCLKCLSSLQLWAMVMSRTGLLLGLMSGFRALMQATVCVDM